MKILKYILIIVVFGGIAYWLFVGKSDEEYVQEKEFVEVAPELTPGEMVYIVEGDTYIMQNGKAEFRVPDSTTVNTLMLFGEEVEGDLDADGDTDAAVWLLNDPGGTGKFYFAVLLINSGTGYAATETMFLGDRIAPQSLEIREGRAVYNFLERKASDPFTAEPTVAKSIWVHYDKARNQIGEWVRDFEGESR